MTSHTGRIERYLGHSLLREASVNLRIVYSSYLSLPRVNRLMRAAETWLRHIPTDSVADNLRSAPSLARAIGMTSCGLAHLSDEKVPIVSAGGPLWGMAGLIASRVLQSPFVFDFEDYFPTWESMRRVCATGIQETLIEAADLVICASESLEQYARHASATTTSLVPNGFDPALYFPRDRDRSRLQLGLPLDRHVLCYAGNLLPRSGILELVRAVALLKKRGTATVLVVLGRGPLAESVLRLASNLDLGDSVFLKQVQHREVALFLGASDVLLAPYLRDRRTDFLLVPVKLAEYMACGRPIVISDVGEIRRVVIDGEMGLLSKPGMPSDIADKVQMILDNPELARSMSLKALHRSRCFAWPSLARRLAQQLRTL